MPGTEECIFDKDKVKQKIKEFIEAEALRVTLHSMP